MPFFIIPDPPENTELTTSANTSATLKNSNVTFTCTAEGSPPIPEYRFYHMGTFLGSSSSGTFQTQVTESGLSVFSCVPLNKAGVGEHKSVTINIVGELFWMFVDVCLSTEKFQGTSNTYAYSMFPKAQPVIFCFPFVLPWRDILPEVFVQTEALRSTDRPSSISIILNGYIYNGNENDKIRKPFKVF